MAPSIAGEEVEARRGLGPWEQAGGARATAGLGAGRRGRGGSGRTEQKVGGERVRTAEARGGGTSRSVKSGRQGPGRRSPKAAGFADSRWAGDRPFDTGRLDTGRAGLVKDGKRLARCPGGPAPARHFWR